MGLLTDPTPYSTKHKHVKTLIKYNRRICFLFWLAGLGWFCLLPLPDITTGIYFSENALLPGLVYSEIRSDTVNHVTQLMSELQAERKQHQSDMPYAWLLAKMQRIGLDTYTHNFTLNYPLGGGGKVFRGKNVYGILRAPRIGSTESIVISVPYRPPTSVHPDTTHGIPLILAFAEFARRQKYWAKDIIFLVTDQEQLGVQAWLEAYHGVEDNPVLRSGSLDARAGQIQAAVNLEVQGFDLEYIDIKIEGLNGQLPNLDLHNLVQKLSHKQSIPTGYKLGTNGRRSYSHEDKVWNMVSMLLSQASGVPTGNHGLFLKYGVQAVTLECVRTPASSEARNSAGILSLLKIVEGVSRSLNNLLERFHQSFFFYILITHERFVSIGDYIPTAALMGGALLIKSFILWLTINHSKEDENEPDSQRLRRRPNFNFIRVGFVIILAHSWGILASSLPFNPTLGQLLSDAGLPTETAVFYTFLALSAVGLFFPLLIRFDHIGNEVLQIGLLLELGTALIAVSMLNFALGLLLSVIIAPFAIFLNPERQLSGFFGRLQTRIKWLLLHPLCLVFFVVLALTWGAFPELENEALIKRAFKASLDGITYHVVDSVIYGNYLFDLISIVFYPTWLMTWITLFPKATTDSSTNEATKEGDKLKAE